MLSPYLRSKIGAALVVTLAFIVLLTGLVVAFFSEALFERQISDASARQTKVELLARSAVSVIVGDLREEIKTGSTSVSAGARTLYYPSTPDKMVPARSGNPVFTGALNDPTPNLIRRSVRGDTLSALFGSVAASAVNSASDASANGRSISPARWNFHCLLPRQTPGANDLNTTPVAGFVAPDWVMVKPSGPVTLTAPNKEIVGRYAFAIYDEGGLLDANVAGYPPELATYPNAPENIVSLKGSAVLADLSVIGLNNAGQLIGWRNYATAKPAGSLGGYVFSSASLAKIDELLRKPKNSGFLKVSPEIFNGQTDQVFTSRQALLKFQRAAGLALDSLQYLGTHTRAFDQPSFRPEPNRPKNKGAQLKTDGGTANGFGGNDAYDANGKLQDEINPWLLENRKSDGTPVAQNRKRFPLSRLALFEQSPASVAADMKQFFGLVWNNSANYWEYTGSKGLSPSYRIKKLSEVADEEREPDFFEALKAAICCDSLGKQHGGNESFGARSRFTGKDSAMDGYIDLQVIQIGANIIDQYDVNGYPTAIYTGPGPVGSSGKSEPLSRTAFGVENIPYLYGWMSAWYRMRQLTSADILPDPAPPARSYRPSNGKFPYETAALIQPIVWNPHVPVAVTSNTPSDFRIVAGGVNKGSVPVAVHPLVCSTTASDGASAWWDGYVPEPTQSKPAKLPVDNATGLPVSYVEAVVSPATSWITFNTTATGKASFREPYRIQSPNYPPGSNAIASSDGEITPLSDQELNDPNQPDTIQTKAIGFYTGRCWTGPTTSGNLSNSYLNAGTISQPLRLELQYRKSDGTYITYDIIDFVQCYGTLQTVGQLSIVDNDDTVSSNRGMQTGFRADPRTNRWGLPRLRVSPRWDARFTPSGLPNPAPTDAVFTSQPIYKWPQGTTLAPDGTTSTGGFYRLSGDGQGGVPKTSGWKVFGSSPSQCYSDLMVNLITVPGGANPNTTSVPGGKSYYTDPDGVLRRADGAYFTSGSRDGLPLSSGNLNSRPIVLNRPFRSISELGYAFRDIAWRNLDFFTPESGDAALLDVFCLTESSDTEAMVAGRVNLNSRQPRVLAALMSGVSKAEGGMLSSGEAIAAANALVTWTADTATKIDGIPARGPLRNRSELIGKYVASNSALISSGPNRADVPNINGSLAYSGYSDVLKSGIFSNPTDGAVKRRHESIVRALADAGEVRTWNLMIDLVAQAGRYTSGATQLSQFLVEGETRLWVHLSIDRFTGEVIAKQIEVVSE